MRVGFVLAMMARDARGARGRLFFFTACLAVGVAAVVGVAGLVAAVEDGIRGQSRQILGGDLAVESRRPLPSELDDAFDTLSAVERTDVRDLATMASIPKERRGESHAGTPEAAAQPEDRPIDGGPDASLTAAATGGRYSRLVELRVVDGRYPLFGETALEPSRPLDELLDARSVVVATELAEGLRLGVEDEIELGGETFRISGLLLREPDRLGFSLTLGPRVYVSAEGFARTGLATTGSRIRYRALYALPETSTSALAALKQRLQEELPGSEFLRVETHDQAQPDLRRSIDRVASYLGLVALLSLVLGGAGVAQIVRAWLARRTAEIAVLRCLGFRAREILVLTLANVALLATVGSVIGAACGSALPFLAPRIAPTFFPPELVDAWQPGAVARGLALGVGIALCFSVLPLSSIWQISPARVLRSEVEPLSAHPLVRALAILTLAAAVFSSAWLQSGSLVRAASFAGGLAVLAALLFAAARALTWAAARLPRRGLGPYVRQGIAALARPGAGTVGAIVAVGLGVMVVVAMALVERGLARELGSALPSDAPTVFLVDVQPDQWSGIRAELESEQATSIDTVPVVTARIAAIDGRPVDEIAAERRASREEGGRGRPRWVLTREQRLTWLAELSAGNVVTALDDSPGTVGPASPDAPWVDPLRAEVSLEEDFAEDLGVGIGSTLTFDVQGIDVELRVTSLRVVDWKTFGINFFLVVEPGVLERAPHFQIAAARVSSEAEARVQDRIASAFPNVTMIRVRAILEKVADVLARLGLAVRILGSFTIVTGLAILAGVVAAAAAHRGREVALLKTLGLTRAGVVRLFAVEHALSGLVAGAIGAGAAILLARVFLAEVLDIRAETPLLALPIAALGSAFLSAVCGVAASARALAVRPIESLRG